MNTRFIEPELDNEPMLRRQIVELDSLFNKSPNCVAVLDPELRYVRVNDALARFCGIPPESFAGRSVSELFPELTEDFVARLHAVTETNKPLLDIELSLTGGGDEASSRYFLVHFYPLDAPQDESASVGMVMVDVTER